jgi:hypothetical protein
VGLASACDAASGITSEEPVETEKPRAGEEHKRTCVRKESSLVKRYTVEQAGRRMETRGVREPP